MGGGCGESIRIDRSRLLVGTKGVLQERGGGDGRCPGGMLISARDFFSLGVCFAEAALIAALSEVCREVRKAVLE
jgi:hypothetical protein